MRNKISKLIAVLLVCIMALGNISAFASDETDYIAGAGIAPDGFAAAADDEAITRGEYAYIMANLFTSEELAPCKTRFNDVNGDSFSGHVEFLAQRGIAGGYGDGNFGKNDKLTLETAYIFILRVLAFNGLIVKPEAVNGSYTNFAYMIGLKPGVYTNAEGYVTKRGAMQLAYNALTTETRGASYRLFDGRYELCTDPAVTGTLLSNALGISVYEGTISDVDTEKDSLTFTVSKNMFKFNPVILNRGDEKTLFTNPDTDFSGYAYMPVTVWVDKEDNIVSISEAEGISVKYLNIYSVNGDTSTSNAYSVARIDRMMFYNDETEYDVAENATFSVNGEEFTARHIFAGKYAKVIFNDDEIIHVETWDLVEGGIITAVESTQIKYLKGNVNQILRNIDTYDRQEYILNGKSVRKEQLPQDSLFYYYKNDALSYIVIAVQGKVVTDVLSGTTGSMLIIGNDAWAYDISNMYYRYTGKEYRKLTSTSTLSNFFGHVVNAYIAPDGNIRYLSLGAEETGINEFYGAIIGIKENMFDSEIGEVKMYVLDKDLKIETFSTTQKTVYDAGLDLAALGAKGRAADGSGVFKFQINAKGYITKVSKPGYLYGWGDGPVVGTRRNIVYENGKLQVTVDSKNVYFTCDTIFAIYELDGEFTVSAFAPSEELNKVCSPNVLSFTLYGEGESSNPSLVVVTGPLEQFGSHKSEMDLIGIITDKTKVIGADDRIMYKLDVLGTTGKEVYYVTEEYATSKGLEVDKYIQFRNNVTFSLNDIYITKVFDISSSPDVWNDEGGTCPLVRGTVDMADTNRFVLTDGTPHYYAYNFMGFCVDTTSGKREYTSLDLTDLVQGDTVYYYESTYGVVYMLLVK